MSHVLVSENSITKHCILFLRCRLGSTRDSPNNINYGICLLFLPEMANCRRHHTLQMQDFKKKKITGTNPEFSLLRTMFIVSGGAMSCQSIKVSHSSTQI